MSGERDLPRLLAQLSPQLAASEYVFCTLPDAGYGEAQSLSPIAAVVEDEGLTLVVPRAEADAQGCAYNGVFRCITLHVHSSLDAVGLTAAVAAALARREIPANVIAAYHHDHVFVPAAQASDALVALTSLAARA